MGHSGGGTQARAGSPAFLKVDERVPVSVRELLLEADGCIASGFLTGGTACAQRAVEAIFRTEKIEGAAYDMRLRALTDKHSSIPQLLGTILLQFGDAREPARLAPANLELLMAALKALVHEVYVVGPERGERLQYIRRMLEQADRKPLSMSDLIATPGASPAPADVPPLKPAAAASKAPSADPLAALRAS